METKKVVVTYWSLGGFWRGTCECSPHQWDHTSCCSVL